MAKIIINNNEKELPDGSEIKKSCEELGIPFGCETGLCRTCELEVIDGEQNLSPLSQSEEEMFLDPKNRLACRCKIMKDQVKVKSKWQDE